jgi:hypothetical protein
MDREEGFPQHVIGFMSASAKRLNGAKTLKALPRRDEPGRTHPNSLTVPFDGAAPQRTRKLRAIL